MPTMTSTPLRKRVLLRSHADAAEHRRGGHRRMHREIVEVVDDLRRQLARRRQHQRARGAARLVDQLVQDRQQKRGRLAAAGHGAGEQVAALRARAGWRRPESRSGG